MFSVRAILVAFGFFGALYCFLSLLVACAWQCWNRVRRTSGPGSVNLLFGLRVFPLVASAFITLAFALPAFCRFESNAVDEDLGTLLFGVCTLLILFGGVIRVLAAQSRTSQVVADWMVGANALDTHDAAPIWQAKRETPPLTLIGFSRPKVLISEAAVGLLNEEEMHVSVRHEIAHMRSRDNLKKLILHGFAFPGMAALDRAWQAATEFAADHAAVSSPREAIDLAAALVKLSDLVPLQDPPAFTTGLVDVSMLVKRRVQCLLAWNESHHAHAPTRLYFIFPLAMTPFVYAIANYSSALLLTHRVTEWFIR